MIVPGFGLKHGVQVNALRQRKNVRLFGLGQFGQTEVENLHFALSR